MNWAWLKDIFAESDPVISSVGGLHAAAKSKPRLAVVNHAPDRETFATWLDHPVTLFAFAALRNAAAEQKAAWDDASWHAGEADQLLLTELRTRADAYDALQAADYEAFCEWAQVEPEAGENSGE